ncbi:unnamed protein product [Spirodela intermedia]|uniref:Rubisco LSMT substrate-binding domain-containing protein n=1 Tax=Spirodela intermedia TaxID=51605 RepID=A0A7I8IMQ0_SPIIN|nr:unnamed protein product [Spirodela intermedia]CAA6658739.1 unnamed protein product [Spirodela intermedia]
MAAAHCFRPLHPPPPGGGATAFASSSSSSSLLLRWASGERLSPLIPTASPLHHRRERKGKKGALRNEVGAIRPHRAVTAVRSLQSQGREVEAAPNALSSFWKWAVENGATAQAVKLAAVPEGLGLVAQRDLSRNEVVVEVPKRLWISPETVVADPELGRLCSGLRPWVSVALFLLREKARGVESSWKPYLDILPPSTNSPLFWSEQELSELQGQPKFYPLKNFRFVWDPITEYGFWSQRFLRSEFLKVEEDILLPYKRVFPSPITFEDFVWAFGILRSRTFSGLSGENLILTPVADLVNHSPKITSKDSAWEIKGKGLFSREEIFSLRTTVPVKADPESEAFLDDKLDIAESNGLGETAYFDIYLNQALPPLMLPYLRLIALEGSDSFLLEALFRNSVWGHLELPVSYQNEELICRVIRDACRSAMSAYQTTIEEDEAIREAGSLDQRLEIAVWIREGEKKVLKQIDMIFEEREQELGGLEYYQERRLKDLGLVGEEGEIIFWESK